MKYISRISFILLSFNYLLSISIQWPSDMGSSSDESEYDELSDCEGDDDGHNKGCEYLGEERRARLMEDDCVWRQTGDRGRGRWIWECVFCGAHVS